MFIEDFIKDLGTVKRIRNYRSKFDLYLYFLQEFDTAKFANLLIQLSFAKVLISAELKRYIT